MAGSCVHADGLSPRGPAPADAVQPNQLGPHEIAFRRGVCDAAARCGVFGSATQRARVALRIWPRRCCLHGCRAGHA
eukprot:317137-Chlamydomonas_euryale.AAC.3